MDLDAHRHLGHVRDCDNGLAFAHAGPFANLFPSSVVVFIPAAAVNHQAGPLGRDRALILLLVEFLALPALNVVLALC